MPLCENNVPCRPVVLVLDDNDRDRSRLELLCAQSELGIHAIGCRTPDEVKSELWKQFVHVLLLDRDLGKIGADENQNGIDFIPEFLSLQPYLQILVVTGSRSVHDVVRAIQLGATNYITKEHPSEILIHQIESAIRTARYRVRQTHLDRELKPKTDVFGDLVGTSCAIRRVKEQLRVFSESDRPVLLLGESGTGKTTAAHLIHLFRQQHQKQRDMPFFSLNITAISSTLIESELFGYERGAFTDAKEAREGFLELANNGTLFLDEIGEASLEIQAKLLKVLDEKKFFRLGGKVEKKSRFKLICATNRNLEKMVADGKFREDLYMRINIFMVPMPSLQERKEDIEVLIDSLLPKLCQENKIQVSLSYKDLPTDFLEHLRVSPIQGNIRGIEKLMSLLLVLSPKYRDGKPDFSRWRASILPRAKPASAILAKAKEIRVAVDLSNPNFEGLDAVLKNVEKEILIQASENLKSSRDISRVLKLSKATTNRKLSEVGRSRRPLSSHLQTIAPQVGLEGRA